MRVLFVAPDLPGKPLTGAHTRPLSIMRALTAAGHEIIAVGTAASPDGEVAVADEALALCAEVLSIPTGHATPRGRGTLSRARKSLSPVPLIGRGRNAAVAAMVEAACREFRPDVLHLTTMYAVHYRRPDLPAVVDLTDVVSGLCETAVQARPFRNAVVRAQASSARRQERRLLAGAVPMTINDEDRARLGRLGIAAYTVPLAIELPELGDGVPVAGRGEEVTGVPLDSPAGEGSSAHTATLSPPDTHPLELLFVGSMLHAPNREAARFLVEKLAPELRCRDLGFRLIIAGRAARPDVIGLRPATRGGATEAAVEFCPDVPDLAPLYRRADIVLAPLPHGGGTKNKTLEAMAFARPVIGTRQAFTGIDPRAAAEIERGASATSGSPAHPAGVQTDYDAAALAAAVAELAADPARRERMGRAGRDYVAAYHSQELVNRRVRVLYDAIGRGGGVVEAEAAWAATEIGPGQDAQSPRIDGDRRRESGAGESRTQTRDRDANGGGADG